MNNPAHRLVAAVLVLLLAVAPAVQADVISTGSALQTQAREQQLTRIDTFFARDDVRNALIAHGVNPNDATRRINALTDSELQQLAARIDQLPAGGVGVIEVVGIVAIVLLILELLGVTNVFTRF